MVVGLRLDPLGEPTALPDSLAGNRGFVSPMKGKEGREIKGRVGTKWGGWGCGGEGTGRGCAVLKAFF